MQHAEGGDRIFVYGGSGQLCSSVTYGLGYATRMQDEAGSARQSWVDGFGRTIEVDEADASNNLTIGTCYKYDALNNLIEVDQGGQTRTYTYDGLSRLTSSTTPESGTANLYYTTSGGSLCAAPANALCRRTDARAITTTYAYDALGRLTSKTYSNGAPTASFYYDEASVAVGGTNYPLSNTKGRLSHTWVAPHAAVVTVTDSPPPPIETTPSHFSNVGLAPDWGGGRESGHASISLGRWTSSRTESSLSNGVTASVASS